MSKIRLEDLKKGDLVKIEYGYGFKLAKVKANYTDSNRIYIQVGGKFLGLFFIGWLGSEIKDYGSYSFDNLDILNA